MSSKSFSQTDTTKINQIQLTKPIARLVIKDLIKYDGLRVEINTLESVIAETNKKMLAQNKLITNLETQNLSLEDMICTLNKKYETQERLTKEFETALRRQQKQAKFYKVGSLVGISSTILLLLVK